MLKANSRIIHLHKKAPFMREGARDTIMNLSYCNSGQLSSVHLMGR